MADGGPSLPVPARRAGGAPGQHALCAHRLAATAATRDAEARVMARKLWRTGSVKVAVKTTAYEFVKQQRKNKEGRRRGGRSGGGEDKAPRVGTIQGEVEKISLKKPKAQGPHDEGFLEYLEYIIGTNQYVDKIEETCKQLESLNEKRTASVQMLKLAEKERETLESAKNEAETYLLKELSLLKWQEKATKLASDDDISRVAQCQENVADLENNLASERLETVNQNGMLPDYRDGWEL